MNKRSQTPIDTILAIVLLFGMVIVGMTLAYFIPQIFDSMKLNPVLNASNATITVFNKAENIVNNFDWMIFAVMIGFCLSMIIAGYFIPTQSVFIVIYTIVLLVGVVISFIFNYIYSQLILVSPFSDMVSSYPISNFIMTNLGIFFTIFAALALVATYGKPGVNQ